MIHIIEQQRMFHHFYAMLSNFTSCIKITRLIFFGLLFMIVTSCYHNSRLVYLQDKKFSKLSPTVVQNKKVQYRLQPSDILSVQVKSTTEAASSNAIFNVASQQNGAFTSPGSFFLEGYTIDSKGKINIPILGEMAVKDLTLEEAQQLIQLNANKYLTKATVIVKLTSFKVTVLGEVKNPGYLYVYNNQVTILETLGLAGDLTTFANRENIKLIRQTPTGSQVVLLDLTDPKLLSSEYFFLMPNDVLYIEPVKARAKRTNLEVLGVIFTGLTTGVLILSYVTQD
jgi:polysaccharide biosynthesis/export protein